jgi:hypothetical protein
MGAVVAMINVPGFAGAEIHAFENNGSISSVIIMVFQIDPHTGIFRETHATEAVGRKRAVML